MSDLKLIEIFLLELRGKIRVLIVVSFESGEGKCDYFLQSDAGSFIQDWSFWLFLRDEVVWVYK